MDINNYFNDIVDEAFKQINPVEEGIIDNLFSDPNAYRIIFKSDKYKNAYKDIADAFAHAIKDEFKKISYSQFKKIIFQDVTAELYHIGKLSKSKDGSYIVSDNKNGLLSKETKAMNIICDEFNINPDDIFTIYKNLITNKTSAIENAILESTKLSMDDKIIYTDQIPKSLYEYYYNKYTEKDMNTLIENIKMEYDIWDKTENLFRTSNSIQKISNGDIAILYKSNEGNMFIYSLATEKYYYYDINNPELIDLKEAMNFDKFISVCKRDFEALLRTPYGNKFVTESSVIKDELHKFFNNPKSIRVTLDGVFKSEQKCFEDFSYAFNDALLQYTDKLITPKEFDRISEAFNCSCEVYTNNKLGVHDYNKSAEPIDSFKEKLIEGDSFKNIISKFGEDSDKVYNDYYKTKQLQLIYEYFYNNLEKNLKNHKLIKESLNTPIDVAKKQMKTIMNDPMYWSNKNINLPIIELDLENYYIKTDGNCEKLSSELRGIVNIPPKLVSPYNSWNVKITESGNSCYVTLSKDDEIFVKEESKFTTDINSKSKKVISDILFEEFTGVNFETYNQDLIKMSYNQESYDYKMKNECNPLIEEMISNNLLTKELLENTLDAVTEAEERSLARKINHKIKDGIDSATRVAKDVHRNVSNVVNPLLAKAKKFADGLQKSTEEDEKEAIITESKFNKVTNFIKKYIIPYMGLKMIFAPWKVAIAMLIKGYYATDDIKMRRKILGELELELKLTREKIEDARGDGNKKAKYDLIRLESRLESEIDRIKNPS